MQVLLTVLYTQPSARSHPNACFAVAVREWKIRFSKQMVNVEQPQQQAPDPAIDISGRVSV